MPKPTRVSPKQVREWFENPVTLAFLEQTKVERDEIVEAKGLNAFHPFDANKTQELLASLNGYADALDRQIAALEGEGFMSEEDEDGQID